MGVVALLVIAGVVLPVVLLGVRAAGRWLAKAIARDIHDGIGKVVREQLGPIAQQVTTLDEKFTSLEARDAQGHTDVMNRLDEVEKQNTLDHGAVAERLAAVEKRLEAVENRLPQPEED
jgi:hypothetical protein